MNIYYDMENKTPKPSKLALQTQLLHPWATQINTVVANFYTIITGSENQTK